MSQLSPVLPTQLASCPSLWVSAPRRSCAPAPLPWGLACTAGLAACLVPCTLLFPVLCADSAGVSRGAAKGMSLHHLRWREKGSWEAKCYRVPVQQVMLAPSLVLRASQAGVAGATQLSPGDGCGEAGV